MTGGLKYREQGFTLVEVLVALFIFSLISLGTMSAMTSALRGQAQLNEATDRIAEIDTARALIKADMANLLLRPSRDGYGNRDLFVISGGVDTLLTFTRSGRDNPGGLEKRGDLQRVAYVFEDGNLIRRTRTEMNPAPQSEPIDRVLISDLSRAEVSFFDRDLEYSQLFIPADGQTIPYSRVKFTLTTEAGDQLTQIFELSL